MVEQRRSCRFGTVAPEQKAVRVYLGRSGRDAEVVEQSAGGMLIRVAGGLPGVAVDSIVDVEGPAGRIQGRVAHLGSDGEGVRIGIQRLAELVRTGSSWRPPPWCVTAGGTPARSRALIWLCMVAIILGAIAGALLI